MSENPDQPKEYDAVLGGQTPPPINSLVLGGIEGIKRRLDSNDINVKINALSDAIKYGSVGLSLVIESFEQDRAEQIRKAAYLLLRQSREAGVEKILQDYDHWSLFDRLYALEEKINQLSCIVISPDNQTLFSGHFDGNIKAWDLNTRKLKYTVAAKSGCLLSLNISSDGKRLASGGIMLNTIKIWDINPEKLEQRLVLKDFAGGQVCSLAFNANGQNIFSLCPYGRIINWDLTTGKGQRFEGDTWAAQCFAISQSRQSIVTGMNEVNLWDASTGKLKKTLQQPQSPITFLAISHDEKIIVSFCENYSINVWDADTGNIVHNFTLHPAPVTSLAISNDGKTLICGNFSKTIEIWDLNTLKLKKALGGLSNLCRCIVVSSDEQLIVSGGDYDSIRVWGLSERLFSC